MIRARLHDWWAHRLWMKHQRIMKKRSKLKEQTKGVTFMMVKHQRRAKELRDGS